MEGFIFFAVVFYDLRYVICTNVADLYIVSVKNLSKGAMIREVFAYEI